MVAESKHRKWVFLLAPGLLLLLLLFFALQAFNPPPFVNPRSNGQIFLFTAVTVVVFLLLLTVLVLLFRNVVKLLADQRSRVFGARFRGRMLVGALLLSFTPAVFMFLFSFLLLNRSIERWFSQPGSQIRDKSTSVALELSQYAAANARAEAESLASSSTLIDSIQANNYGALVEEMRTHRITLEGGFAAVFHDATILGQYQFPRQQGQALLRPWMDNSEGEMRQEGPLPAFVLKAAQRSDQPILVMGKMEYILGAASTQGGNIVVVGLPMPEGLSATVENIRSASRDYWQLFGMRNRIRNTYLLLLILLTTLTFFVGSWLALFLAKQVTKPVEALADAMDEIAQGHYGHRVRIEASEELGELVNSFNRMAGDLEESRALAETSTTQLSAANRALEARRSELETVLETIPNGVVTLDAQMRVLQANRAFQQLLHPQESQDLSGMPLEAIFPEEIAEELILLARRSHRMGVAATEIELTGPRGVLTVTAAVASLDLGNDRQGCILVLEDVTQLLHAQRQAAWKEVARRVAHEIKNPLTPISLSAERIRKHMDRTTPESPNVIRKCSEVILGSVETLRKLVDQFAALAQFPSAQPRQTDLNAIVENSLALFAGRLNGIRIVQHLGRNIPPVLADPEAMKRAIANLIDNAAEAMQNSLLRQLTIETSTIEGQSMAEIVVADTGHGLNDEIRERLFLPYFSTKQRGTGLGLAIAAKIIQDHHGAIRAEQNSPAGSRFIIELPLAEAKSPGETPLASANSRTVA
jgi:two-component system, NtrC family, nitrogen regulation sensor histidine kinase NtrY